jgi:hypothetical protein
MLKNKKMMKGTDVRKQALQAIKDCFAQVPFVKSARIRSEQWMGGVEVDVLADLHFKDGSSRRIVAEVKASGQPRIAREAVNQLFRVRAGFPDIYGVFIAPYISSRSAEICLKEGFGYLDLVGNCRLSFGQVFICKEGFSNSYVQKRELRSLYSPRSTRILRVLLTVKNDRWRTQSLATEAGVSLGQVANVRKLLRDREWITEGKEGLRLTDPKSLLDEWAEHYSYRKNAVREFYSIKETEEIESELSRIFSDRGIQYAFTGFSGARHVAPTVRGQRVMAYVSSITEEVLRKVGLKEVPSGANVSLMIPYDEGVYYEARMIDSLKIVCPVQLYLDLKGYRGRGEEAAEAILNQVLVKQW